MAHYNYFEELEELSNDAENLINQLSKFINYLKKSDRKDSKFD